MWNAIAVTSRRADARPPAPCCPQYTPEKEEFMTKLFSRTGIDPEGSFLPPWLNPEYTQEPKMDMDTALKEAHMVMTGAVGEVLDKTGEAVVGARLPAGSGYQAGGGSTAHAIAGTPPATARLLAGLVGVGVGVGGGGGAARAPRRRAAGARLQPAGRLLAARHSTRQLGEEQQQAQGWPAMTNRCLRGQLHRVE